MAKYQKYAEYKESGVQWIGEIPDDWKFLRGKWKFNTLKEVNRDLQCMDRLALTMNGVIERSIDSDEGLQPAEFSGYQIFEKDDLVFKLIDLENFKTSRVGLVFKRGIMSPAYIRLRPLQGTYSRFFYYFYFDLYLRGVYNQIGGQGVRSALNATDLLEIEICVPALEEQIQIANFLDYETAKIDTLIAKQEKLIELLKEKRQAVISHAVTKGLNPNVPMKNSGVEWLGEVPEHWTVSKFGYISQVVRGGSPRPAGDPTLFNGDYSPWVTVAEITKDDELYLTSTETFLTKKGSEQCRVFQTGTLLLSNSGATLGVPKILCINANANDGVVGFEELKIDTEYAYFYLSVLTNDLRERVKQGSGQPNLNTDIVKAISITLPPENEIKEIVADIKKKIDHFSKLMASAENAIHLMKERRTVLISAAVIGKIDVHNWQHLNQKNNHHTELSA